MPIYCPGAAASKPLSVHVLADLSKLQFSRDAKSGSKEQKYSLMFSTLTALNLFIFNFEKTITAVSATTPSSD